MRRTLVDLLQRDIDRDPAARLDGADSHDLFSLWLFPVGEEPQLRRAGQDRPDRRQAEAHEQR